MERVLGQGEGLSSEPWRHPKSPSGPRKQVETLLTPKKDRQKQLNLNMTSNKCIATSNKCLTSSNKKLLGTRCLSFFY